MGLIGGDRGEEQIGKLPLRRRGLRDLLDLDLRLGIGPGLDRQGIKSPEAKNRVVQPAKVAEALARDRMSFGRCVRQRPRQRQAQPVGPVGAPRHGRYVTLGVFGYELGPDSIGEDGAGKLGYSSPQAQIPQLSLLDPGVVTKAEGGMYPQCVGFPDIAQHVDVSPDVA